MVKPHYSGIFGGWHGVKKKRVFGLSLLSGFRKQKNSIKDCKDIINLLERTVFKYVY